VVNGDHAHLPDIGQRTYEIAQNGKTDSVVFTNAVHWTDNDVIIVIELSTFYHFYVGLVMLGGHSEEVVYQEVTTHPCYTAEEIRL